MRPCEQLWQVSCRALMEGVREVKRGKEVDAIVKNLA
jgi:hypothetical protein